MHFSQISAVLLGLATFASAIPRPYDNLALRAPPNAVERGLIWSPRSLYTRDKKNKNNDVNIVIAQNVNIQLTQVQIIQEIQIVNVIQNIIIIDGKREAQDNIRKNHYRNQRNDGNVNVIIIVVIAIVNSNDQNVRYLTRQVEANPGAPSQEWVVVSEVSALTVDNQNPTAGIAAPTGVVADPALATGVSQAPLAVYDPNSALQLSGEELLLPEGSVAPKWEAQGAKQDNDPAVIIEVDQAVFVVFVDGNDNNDDKKNDDKKKEDDKKDDEDDKKD